MNKQLAQYINELRKLVEEGKLENAIKRLLNISPKDKHNEIRIQASRFYRLKEQNILGILPLKESNLEHNTIVYNLLQVIDVLEEELIKGILVAKEIEIITAEDQWQKDLGVRDFSQKLDTESPLPNQIIEDLEKETLNTFLQEESVLDKLAKEYENYTEMSKIEKLEAFYLVEEKQLLKGTFLSLGQKSKIRKICITAYPSSFVTFEDNDGITPRILEEVEGNLLQQFRAMMLLIQKNLFLERDIYTNSSDYEIPYLAFREILANAYIHRDYSETADAYVQVELYPNRIEIKNPGVIAAGVDLNKPETILFSKLKNISIAHIFYLSGIVEKKGTGIKRTGDMLKKRGFKPPLFDIHPLSRGVRVILYKRDKYIESISYQKKIAQIQAKDTHYIFLFGKINSGKTALISYLIKYLLENGETEGILTLVNLDRSAYVLELLEGISHFQLPNRTEPTDEPIPIEVRYIPSDKTKPIRTFTLLEIAGESLEMFGKKENDKLTHFSQGINAYFHSENISISFILCTPFDKINEDVVFFTQFIQYVEKNSSHFKKYSYALLITKWDKNFLEKSIETIITETNLKFILNQIKHKNPLIMGYSIGTVDDKRHLVTQLNNELPQKLWYWLYEAATGVSLLSLPLPPPPPISIWERLKFFLLGK